MKRIISAATLLFIGIQGFSQVAIPSKIKNVKVFKNNAEINRTAKATVTPGKQEIVITGISTSIDPSSLQIKFNKASSELLSAKYEPNHILAHVNNPKVEELKTISEGLADDLSWVTDQKNALLGMEEVLKKNQDLGGQSGFTPAQVMELSNKYRTKYLEIRKELKTILKEEKKVKTKLASAKRQLQEMNAKFNKPTGTIVLQVSSRATSALNINCTYTVRNAGWTPLYDLRSSGISENVKLNYRANVYQNTGQDWKDVNMTVSTGNPTQNSERPILSPLYVNIQQPYRIKALGKSKESALNMGLASKDERADEHFGYVANAQIGENQLNVEFKIENKQSVLSDGKKNLLALNTYSLPTKYIYHTVPKLCDGAFLLAKIADWSQYNLVAGKANLFFEGAFVGTSYINPNITSDTMLLSMGRDNGIVVERKAIEKYAKTKAIGSNKKETIGYELIVKNKKSIPITIEVMDQIPLSQSSQINVELENKGNAEHNRKIGKLLWTTTIAPRASWKDQFVYTVKYPKNNAIAGIK